MSNGLPVDIVADGFLWLINRQVFHPYGFTLGYDPEHCTFTLYGNGSEPYVFPGDGSSEREYLDRVHRTLRQAWTRNFTSTKDASKLVTPQWTPGRNEQLVEDDLCYR